MLFKAVIEPDVLVAKLAEHMRAANLDWNNSTAWTAALKRSLKTILESQGANITDVLYSDRESDSHEFLLDVVVWDRSEGEGEGVTLAVESEWEQNVDAVEEDFWKLLVVKAPLKLMIFACNRTPKKFSQEAVWTKLGDCLLKYRNHLQGERYLFIDFAPVPGRRAWWIELPTSGKLDTVPERQFIELT